MNIIAWFKEKIRMLFKTDAEKAFGVETYLSPSRRSWSEGRADKLLQRRK